MDVSKVSDMTLEELREMITTLVDARLKGLVIEKPHDPRSREEVFASIERNRWTPPEGSPSTLVLLREDRDR